MSDSQQHDASLEGRAPKLKFLLVPPPNHPLSTRGQKNTSTTQLKESTRKAKTEDANRIGTPVSCEHEEVDSECLQGEHLDRADVSPTSTEDSKEEELSEEQLRKLFDDEEIERFLRHFSAHVQEVRVPTSGTSFTAVVSESPDTVVAADIRQTVILSPETEESPYHLVKSRLGDDENKDEDKNENENENKSIGSSVWPAVDRTYSPVTVNESTGKPSRRPPALYLSEKIARDYLLPILPPVQPSPGGRFTIGRARLQFERFIVVAQPAYAPFFARLWRYASWKDRGKSAKYCTIFWVLWYLDLLLPALPATILYELFRRRIFSYPTLEELRDRRRETAQAELMGEEVEKRFVAGPQFGVRDAWSLFRGITKGKKKAAGKQSEPNRSPTEKVNITTAIPLDAKLRIEGSADIQIEEESKVERDIKMEILKAISEITDLHERVKNIFLWRRPQTSRNYALALGCIFLVTLLLPARYLAKMTYFGGGMVFWFLPPIILGLPPEERSRLPPAFSDSPTDAQYAMELIALRVSRGESVVPSSMKSGKKKRSNPDLEDPAEDKNRDSQLHNELDWRKWGERASRGFAWAEEGKRVIRGGTFKGDAMSYRKGTEDPLSSVSEPTTEVSSYPAHHTTGPGLITLSSTSVSFSQVLSSKPKVQVRFDQIRGVKKSGKLGGLTVKWALQNDDKSEVKEEKFKWIGGRDEVFAKLVGWGGRQWVSV